jgi:hypothetical protein
MDKVFGVCGIAFTRSADGLSIVLTCPICHGTKFSGHVKHFSTESPNSPPLFGQITCDICGWPGKLENPCDTA